MTFVMTCCVRLPVVDLTKAGSRALDRLAEQVEKAQKELLAPLSARERRELERLLTRVIEHHGERHSG